MNALAQRRAFLQAYRRAGTLAGAAESTGTPAETHAEWMRDPDYSAAYAAVSREIKRPPKPRANEKPKGKPGRPRKQIAAPDPTPDPTPVEEKPEIPQIPLTPDPAPVVEQPPPPPADRPIPETVVYPSKHGHTRVYVRPGEELQPPEPEPERPPRPVEPEPEPTLEITVASDAEQRRLVDEYGELDRRMQLRAFDTARYEQLKRAIKSWFDQAPADADGVVEGDVYLLHLSARERVRQVRDANVVVELIGMDKFLGMVTVPIGALEDILGKAHVAGLVTDSRTGSRRIKAIPKRTAG